MTERAFNSADRIMISFDKALRTLFGCPQITERSNPASALSESDMNEKERDLTARLMRINHTGEVCAQALYQGQALTAKLPEIRNSMERAAQEENDHLAWCETRLDELDNRKSLLNPFWYASSFMIGTAAGLAGDECSLGFVAETEYQVEAHLNDHMKRIPGQDKKSHAILAQMKEDEVHHATVALEAGGAALPTPIKMAMKLISKVMTKLVYYL
ncbi:MAG: 2-polyprenyl-3-methyl-6-methoxy-1,4-benzoquinone monooxygenase [Candidatus Thiodiazotropha sp. (ex Lucinoma aequizonata)]|nr:2-polyprenyl-3-methyl-6-methoxy-1,4-benzoquinone monooxygenase [Candidatus Thiodiazotropha sp. (ex Lucinoma aequizonata)]MCU7888522.1 2-polyprenyl-3-methyl-6-methoxy-1,4-benzoquinone monooxygenase [Candidatus Thiodiazotropha sp. (ex Lucinoma aequizonata)]MCU7894933.1 2-polyprenyl-3-methyl-6-methoxy-1,4-benzoquinone monooxygenase [Candidatus Thiodiazotropha sp. (ex Lucinoma aequizonata)]MCU7897821.1 2-polyprenyl-3-methyl-6-methoxy-1,4-benzoquinone monooxygenase [Candidatus Thiodiazotropha sp. 